MSNPLRERADACVCGLEAKLNQHFRAVVVVGIPRMTKQDMEDGVAERVYWRVFPGGAGSAELAAGIMLEGVKNVTEKLQGD